MRKYKVIGLMSGTSLDGLDIAYCEFGLRNNKWSFEIGPAETMEYGSEWLNTLSGLPQKSAEQLLQYDVSYGFYMGKLVNSFVTNNNLKPELIASHGHTVFHQPEKTLTYQLGNGQAMAKKTGVKVVSDFRTKDVIYGGQGAPLVPIGDELLFGKYAACLNLGGFSNISFVQDGRRIAYDICPVNIALNHISNKMKLDYDRGGEIAASGVLNHNLLDSLNNLAFYKQAPPKSLGREWLLNEFLPLLEHGNLENPDILRTLTEHAAIQISGSIKRVYGKVLVTGGGAFNKFLLSRIIHHSSNELVVPDEKLVSFKEALVFGLLGVLRINNQVNCLASVTGATHDTVCGTIHLP